jgi:hypothetical protein
MDIKSALRPALHSWRGLLICGVRLPRIPWTPYVLNRTLFTPYPTTPHLPSYLGNMADHDSNLAEAIRDLKSQAKPNIRATAQKYTVAKSTLFDRST